MSRFSFNGIGTGSSVRQIGINYRERERETGKEDKESGKNIHFRLSTFKHILLHRERESGMWCLQQTFKSLPIYAGSNTETFYSVKCI